MKSIRRYLFLALIAVAITVVISVVHFMVQSPEAQDQQAIADCWAESKGAKLTPAQQRTVIEACQMLERVYRFNYSLPTGSKDV